MTTRNLFYLYLDADAISCISVNFDKDSGERHFNVPNNTDLHLTTGFFNGPSDVFHSIFLRTTDDYRFKDLLSIQRAKGMSRMHLFIERYFYE